MKLHTFIAGAVALSLPLTALALDYSSSASNYKDAPFSNADNAAISVLTNLGAVSGNPDGSFDPDRAVNRAEFLKIAFLSNPAISVSSSDADDCFPDVHATDWFSQFVCLAKIRNAVGGYPDGFFRPGNVVNYAEAIKMLTELYGYVLPEPADNERWAWYTGYVKASEEHHVLLPSTLSYDEPLTRGRVARLAAAYRAEHDGELDAYRSFELGQTPSSSSSSVSSSSSSISSEASSSSESSVSSSSSSSSAVSIFPSMSHFLLAGTTTAPIMDGTFTVEEDSYLRSVQVELFREIESIDSLQLVDQNNHVIADLVLSKSNNPDDTNWEVFVLSDDYKFTKDTPVQLGIRAVMKTYENGGASNQLVEPRVFKINVQGVTSGNTYNLVPPDLHRPQHQTSHGKITSVENVLAQTMSLPQGINKTLASFNVSAQAITGAIVQLDTLNFELLTDNATVSNIRIGGPSDVQQKSCSVETGDMLLVSCPNIPEGFMRVSPGPVTISIYADVTLKKTSSLGSVQLLNVGRGAIGQNGTIRWTDGTGTFNWIESSATVEDGPIVTVTAQ